MRLRWLTASFRGFLVTAVGVVSGCAPPAPLLPQSHVELVIQDVTAIIEGMVEAHTKPGGMAQLPASHPPLPPS